MKVKFKFRKLSLRPYPGEVWAFDSLKEMRKTYEHMVKEPYPYRDEKTGGRYVVVQRGSGNLAMDRVFLVYAREPHVLAHELSHVILIVFTDIGIEAASGAGEPFCYMLSQLMLEASK